jgi:DNA-binding response OmpR family regulator
MPVPIVAGHGDLAPAHNRNKKDDRSTMLTRDDTAHAVILCADEALRDAIGYWLSALPTQTCVAQDGYHANRLLQQATSRLLITDRVLPPWPGLDTFRSLRGRNSRLQIAFIDGGGVDERILARIAGVTCFVPTPVTRESVVGLLAQFVPTA